MRINHNISALKANNLLNSNDNKLSRNLEKLTSGLKINHASDDAAGMAISQKMKTQIAGLSKASTNASDGISVIQTAEGALEEVNSCLQRMRELSVQAANGIYTTDDRIAIQKEIDALNAEITRISETTEFNTRNLLDGSIDRKSFSNSTSISIVSVSDTVPTADGYKVKISQDARQAVIVGDTLDGITDISQKITKTQEGKININGLDIVVNEGDTYDEVFKQLRDTCADLDIYCFATDATITNDTTTFGQDVYAGYRAEKFGVGTTGKSTTVNCNASLTSSINPTDANPQEKYINVGNITYEGVYTASSTTEPYEGQLKSADGKLLDILYGTNPNENDIVEVKIYEPMNITVGSIDDSNSNDPSFDFSDMTAADAPGYKITIDGVEYTGEYTATSNNGTKATSGVLKITHINGENVSSTSPHDEIIIKSISGRSPASAEINRYNFESLNTTAEYVIGTNVQVGVAVDANSTITIGPKTYTATSEITKEGKNCIKLSTDDEEIVIYHSPSADPEQTALTKDDITKVVINKLEKYSLDNNNTFESSLEPGKDKFLTIKNGIFSNTYTGTLIADETNPNKMTLRAYDGNIFDITTNGSEPIQVRSVVKRADINPSQRLAFVSYNYGSDEKISILCNNPELSKLFGLSTNTLSASGIDAQAELLADPDNGFSNTATVSIYGNKVTISDNNNFEMVIETNPGTANTVFTDNVISSSLNDFSSHNTIKKDTQEHTAIFTVLDAGPLSLQIGANAYQTMEVSIPAVTPKILGVDTVNVGTENGAQKAITAVSAAINTISGIRAKLGAFQNRLEHAISNLDTTNENMTESLSRVEDTDMASEMAAYTQNNILVQAGTSMLAQANQQPQNILSLLKG